MKNVFSCCPQRNRHTLAQTIIRQIGQRGAPETVGQLEHWVVTELLFPRDLSRGGETDLSEACSGEQS